LSIVACKRSTQDIAPDPSARPKKDAAPPDDEVDVWSIVVDDVASPFADAGVPMNVLNRTTSPVCHGAPSDFPTAKRETIDAWDRIASSVPKPIPALRTHVATSLTPYEDAGYPGLGFVIVSAIAFDGAHRDALVFATIARPTILGGVVYHLIRDGDAWRMMELSRCF
jgi:hypothetical protein